MKVLFDHQLFSWQRFGGASKYFAMLISHLPKGTWETSTWLSNNAYIEHLQLFKYTHFLPKYYFRGQGRLMHEIGKIYSIYRLSKKDYDIYHQTHFDPYGIPFVGSKPLVTTFHDTNFSTFNPNPKIVKWQKKSLKRADHIITISENTRQDLMKLFDIDGKNISVIYHGIEPVPPLPKERIFEFPYFLYVGARDQYKNFERFIKAFSVFSEKNPDFKLVCTWKAFSPNEWDQFRKLNIEKRVVHFSASETEMNILYRDAVSFFFPSLYEGFGMPILEAMINHCPVVVSNSSCFPEIAQNAALYFDPYNVDEIVNQMNIIAFDNNIRDLLTKRGDERVKFFSWERSAREHMIVYQNLI